MLFTVYGVLATVVGLALIAGVLHAGGAALWAVGGFALAATAGNVLIMHVLLRRLQEARDREVAVLHELASSDERFRGAFQDAPTGMALVALDGTVLDVNPQLCELVGRSCQEVIGRDFRTVVAPESHEDNVRWARRALTGDREPLRLQEDLIRADGRRVRVHVTSTLLREGDGGPGSFACQVLDLTDLRAAEDQADRNARFAHAVLDSLSAETAVVDRRGRITAVNAAWERALMTGDGLDLLVGVGADYLAHCDRSARRGFQAATEVAVAVRHVLQGADVTRRVPYEIGEGPSGRSLALTVTPLASGGGAVLSHVDETWRVDTQRQIQQGAEQQAVVARLGQQALSFPDVRALLQSAVGQVTETLDVPFGDVFEFDPESRGLRLRAAAGWGHGEIDRLVVEVDHRTVQARVLATDEPVVVDDVETEPESRVGSVHRQLGVRSHVAVPIPGPHGSYGLLQFSAGERRQFTVDDVHFLESVASLLGAATARERSERSSREADERLTAELRRSEERFRTLAERASDIVYLRRVKPSPRVEYMSPAVERVLGYPPERWYEDESFSDTLIDPAVSRALDRYREGDGQERFQLRMRHADGGWRWLEFRTSALFDDDGEIEAIQGIARDITDLKDKDRQLQARGTRQAALAELSLAAVTEPLDDFLAEACARVSETLEVPFGAVMQREDGHLSVRVAHGLEGVLTSDCRLPIEEGSLSAYALASGTTVAVPDLEREGRFAPDRRLREAGLRSALAVVIPARRGAYGTIAVGDRDVREFHPDDADFLQGVAFLVAAVIERDETEQALQASEERFRLLAENASDIVFLRRSSAEPTFEFMSPSTERILGYPPERWYEDHDFSLSIVHPDDAELFRSQRTATTDRRFIFRARHADGRWRSMEMHSSPVIDGDGDIVAVQGIVRDVTDVVALGERLQERISQQATLAELGIRALDGDPNHVLEQIVDRVRATLAVDLVGVLELLADEEAFLFRAGHGLPGMGSARIPLDGRSLGQYALEAGRPVIVHDLAEEDRFEPAPILHEIGARSCLAAVIPGPDGPIGAMGVFAQEAGAFTSSDADFLQSIAALVGGVLGAERERDRRKATEERLQLLAENAVDVVYRIRATEPAGFEYVSPAVTAMTGYTPDDLYADPSLAISIVHPDDREVLAANHTGDAAGTVDYRVRWTRRDGAVIWVEQRARNHRDGYGRIVAIEGIAREVTEQVEAEQALEEYALELEEAHDELLRATRLRDDFLALTSHELRTPMTPIMGFLDILQKRWDVTPDEKKREYIGVMDRQARRLYHLVSDLLVMSQVSAGTLLGSPDVVDVPALLIRVLDGYPGTGDDVDVEVVAGARAYADPKHVEKILANYLGNAFKYGGAPITVRIVEVGDQVEVRVLDRGSGVREDMIPTLFDRFTQGDVGDRRTAKGTGLGLAVCRELATLNGGEVWYEPREGGGACFGVRLPARSHHQ